MPASLSAEEWSNSDAGAVIEPADTETAINIHADAAEVSDSQSYVNCFFFYFFVCHHWISSVQDSNSGDTNDSSNVMLLSCQDPLLVATYKNLPKIPYVSFLLVY